MDNLKIKQILAKLALLSATLIWGSSFVIMKNTVDTIPPNLLLAIRFTAAFLILGAVFSRKWKLVNHEYILTGLAAGICLYTAYITQTLGLTLTTPGKNAFLTAVYCVIVPFMFWATDKIKPGADNLAAALLCLSGIGLVSLTASFTIQKGDILTLLGGFMFAAHIVVLAKTSGSRDPILITILQFGFAALLSWCSSLIFEGIPYISQNLINGELAFALIYLSVFCTAVTLMFQTIGLKYTSPAAASIILSLESVFGVIFSIILYNEEVTPRLLSGFILIFISIIVSEIRPIRKIMMKISSNKIK